MVDEHRSRLAGVSFRGFSAAVVFSSSALAFNVVTSVVLVVYGIKHMYGLTL